jgi:hypothetical protein
MSKLSFFGRPWVVFDASNEQHRAWYTDFQRRGTWGHCPVRFILAEGSGNLVTQIQRELVQFYIDEEFA